MAAEPTIEVSEDLAALLKRADLAAQDARRLVSENEMLRQTIQLQLDCMLEIGAEFSRSQNISYPPPTP